MNPELIQMLAKLQMLQHLSGPMALSMPSSFTNPMRMQASNAGDMDAVGLLEQLRRGAGSGPAPQMTREPQKQDPGFFQRINPDHIIGEALRGANERSQRDLNRERIRGGY